MLLKKRSECWSDFKLLKCLKCNLIKHQHKSSWGYAKQLEWELLLRSMRIHLLLCIFWFIIDDKITIYFAVSYSDFSSHWRKKPNTNSHAIEFWKDWWMVVFNSFLFFQTKSSEFPLIFHRKVPKTVFLMLWNCHWTHCVTKCHLSVNELVVDNNPLSISGLKPKCVLVFRVNFTVLVKNIKVVYVMILLSSLI